MLTLMLLCRMMRMAEPEVLDPRRPVLKLPLVQKLPPQPEARPVKVQDEVRELQATVKTGQADDVSVIREVAREVREFSGDLNDKLDHVHAKMVQDAVSGKEIFMLEFST